jgi:uncharacterized membrane protein YfcA
VEHHRGETTECQPGDPGRLRDLLFGGAHRLLVTLPLLRFVVESSEHVYNGTDTIFDATIANRGLLRYIRNTDVDADQVAGSAAHSVPRAMAG